MEHKMKKIEGTRVTLLPQAETGWYPDCRMVVVGMSWNRSGQRPDVHDVVDKTV